MTDEKEDTGEQGDDHFTGLDHGAGCTEIWEHLSEYRAKQTD